uniref:Thioredoxin domain-containing protein n=1 Tax=Biomphalaria glabrata TaxID=6526 RepID=A0A2C9KM30_BIOGL
MVALQTPACNFKMHAYDFRLKNVDNTIVSLDDFKKKKPKGLVVAFICNHCPFVVAILDKIVKDASELMQYGVEFVAIMPNDYIAYPQDSFEKMQQISKEKKFTFPYLLDDTQEVAKQYGAVCTPDFFGFNADFNLIYRGRLDVSEMTNVDNAERELFNAMVDVSNGIIPNKQNPSKGCSIKWKL